MGTGAGPVSFDRYRSTVGDRLEDRGFREIDDGPEGYETAVFQRDSLAITEYGPKRSVVVLASFADPAIRTVREFSSRSFAFASDRAGFGQTPVAYAVAACQDPSRDLARWTEGYQPSHWFAYEFPVLADMRSERVHYCSDTPLLGGRSYAKFRKTAAAVLDPSEADPDLASGL